MIKACIFDCDGTLVDSLVSISYCANKTLNEFGYPDIEFEKYKILVGDGAKMLILRCLQCVGAPEDMLDTVLARYKEHFKVDCTYQVKPYDGILDLLAELKKRGIRTAVFSNKPHAQTVTVIDSAFEKDTFDMVLGQKENLPIKPAPDGALLIAESFGVKPEECLYFGDTNTDMQTGNSAGMHTVGVLWGFRDREELEKNHAEHIIGHPREAAAFLD